MNEERPADSSSPARAGRSPAEWLLYAALGLAAVAVPPFLSRLDLPILGRTDFDVFAGTASIALAVFGWREWRKRRHQPWVRLAPLALLLMVAFRYLQFITEYSVKDWDYRCYETAAQDVLAGRNPYRMGNLHSYLYPPVPAQLFAVAYGVVDATAGLVGRHPTPATTWDLVFYLYQCGQLAMVLQLQPYRLGISQGVGISTYRAAAGNHGKELAAPDL